MNYISKTIVFILSFALTLIQLQATQQYTIAMSADQYSVQFSAYIAQFNKKKCYVRPTSDRNACVKYCKYYYDYVPFLPYQNAQHYNVTTKLCEPKIFCPRAWGIDYDSITRTCKDTLLGITVPPIGATQPVYNLTMNVTVICQHGKVINFMGKPDCQCDLGWGSLPTPYLGKKISFRKCNQQLGVGVYFPNFLKIYYDEAYDNMFPYGASPTYWSDLIQYYLRAAKYSIITFFVPYQIQLVLIAIPTEPTFKQSDWIWFIWIILFFFILTSMTLFQICLNGVKKNRIAT